MIPFPTHALCVAALLTGLAAASGTADAAVYYVANTGADGQEGRSPDRAWQTLARVNAAGLKPGDRVLFRCGDTWRGQLVPKSGGPEGPVTYGAFGSGPKPLLLGSVAKNDPAGWREQGGSIWMTTDHAMVGANRLPNPIFAKDMAGWALHTEQGAAAEIARDLEDFDSAPASLRVQCTVSGHRGNHIQLVVGPLRIERGRMYRLSFRAKASRPISLLSPTLHKNGPPWTEYSPSLPLGWNRLGARWTLCTQFYEATVTAEDARLTFYLGTRLPANTTLHLDTVEFAEATAPELLWCDVGNIIFDDGAACGVKVFQERELNASGKYWYDENQHLVKLCSVRNPAEEHRKIECALRTHIISQSHTHHVVYEGLALRYGAAHGIGGGDTHHIVVRDCEFGFIGGGDQYGGGRTVRFGNGVEFWGSAHDNLVERCLFYEIYDAALTNQNDGQREEQYNLCYRYNVIANSEYSFEYWNRPADSRTWNIRFENNTCVGAGHGWGHVQRPDPSGRHLCFYDSPAAAEKIVIRNNIFFKAKGNAFYAPGWDDTALASLAMDHNCWFQDAGTMIHLKRADYAMGGFARYQARHKLDQDSLAADPLLLDPVARDFHLKVGSPCIDHGTEAGTIADFEGTPVPQGDAPDIGAYEHRP